MGHDEDVHIWRYGEGGEWCWAWTCKHGVHYYGYKKYSVMLNDIMDHFDNHYSMVNHGA